MVRFKNCTGIKIEDHVLSVIMLPNMGGKIVSIYRKDKEFELLFQNKENKFKNPVLYDKFEEFDASGFDDAFPTIDECVINYNERKIIYPDHGEIWTAKFNYKIEHDKVQLIYKSSIFNYLYKKTIYIEDDKVKVDYKIINTGQEDFPCIWSMHCLINCEENMEINFPNGTSEIVNVHESKFLGQVGSIHSYPSTKTLDNKPFRLDRVLDKTFNNTEKFYVKNKIEEGKCGVYYPSKNINYNIYFNTYDLPYLGFWVTEGGFRGDYNCALEPSSSYYDSVETAIKTGTVILLKPGKSFNFHIDLELK